MFPTFTAAEPVAALRNGPGRKGSVPSKGYEQRATQEADTSLKGVSLLQLSANEMLFEQFSGCNANKVLCPPSISADEHAMTHMDFDNLVNRLGTNFVIAGYMAFATMVIALPPQTIGSSIPLVIWAFDHVKLVIGGVLLFAGLVAIITKCVYMCLTICEGIHAGIERDAEDSARRQLATEHGLNPHSKEVRDSDEYRNLFDSTRREIKTKKKRRARRFSNAICALTVVFYLSCWGMAVIVFLQFEVIPKLLELL